MGEFLLQAKQYNNRQDEIKAAVIEEGTEPTLGVVVAAENVDIDNNKRISVRKGTSQVLSGLTHSFYNHPENDSIAYYMIGATLYKLNADYTGTAVTTLSNSNEVSFDICGDAIVLTNGNDIGFVEGTTFSAFDQTAGQFEELMPAGQFLHYDIYDNVLLVAENNVIHRSKPYNPQVIDRRISDFPLAGEVTMIGAVEDGWYIGTTTGVAFARRGSGQSQSTSDNDTFEYLDISSTPPTHGAFVTCFEYVEKGRERVTAWVSKDGLIVGSKGGEIKNLSYPATVIPEGQSGKLFYREINGTFQFIAVIKQIGESYENTLPAYYVNTENV